MKLGIVGVVNRSQQDIIDNKTIKVCLLIVIQYTCVLYLIDIYIFIGFVKR